MRDSGGNAEMCNVGILGGTRREEVGSVCLHIWGGRDGVVRIVAIEMER